MPIINMMTTSRKFDIGKGDVYFRVAIIGHKDMTKLSFFVQVHITKTPPPLIPFALASR